VETISKDNVILFHQKIIEITGGSMGIRDEKLLDSALNRGFSTFDGEYLYKSDVEKISAITHSLISNHAFVDGNKRIGISIMLLLLKLNKIEITYTQDMLIDLGLGVASNKYSHNDILEWINSRTINVKLKMQTFDHIRM